MEDTKFPASYYYYNLFVLVRGGLLKSKRFLQKFSIIKMTKEKFNEI